MDGWMDGWMECPEGTNPLCWGSVWPLGTSVLLVLTCYSAEFCRTAVNLTRVIFDQNFASHGSVGVTRMLSSSSKTPYPNFWTSNFCTRWITIMYIFISVKLMLKSCEIAWHTSLRVTSACLRTYSVGLIIDYNNYWPSLRYRMLCYHEFEWC